MELATYYLDRPIAMRRAVDVASPEGAARDTALFYIHGGGWHAGTRDTFHHHLEHFSAKGYWCASAGYRLAPHAKWNTQLADVMESYDRFVKLLEERGASVRRIVVLGSSAGAHLASLLALMEPDEVGVPVRLSGAWRKPDACVSINGPGTLEEWPDMHEGIRADIEKVVGVPYGEATDPFAKASPDRYVKPSGPSFLFMVVEHEKFFPHEYVYRMSDSIIAVGGSSEVVYCEGAEHGFFYGVAGTLQKKAMTILEAFLSRL
ncbi:alpha/beta hydrolase [Paenibacillus hemerocallicola]|uniref:Alpha/beta hydrolase n=1 Tax=Paenibacillus hemerocallicola TaxID=1172614 RepID=A0A5C4SWG0_9BACL|nr:alpha/beta hydrolase [Paenibacillus hemerocallicola]TNJ58758.1 alpha/beta hydrolase [Paenibacillus hemerocallicola]